MRKYLRLAKRLSQVVAPVVAASAMLSSPSQAATLALSDGDLLFDNFSQEFSIIETFNDAETDALANGGVVTFDNNSVVDTFDDPLEVFTAGTSIVEGEGRDYIGLANTKSTIVANFDIPAGEDFSFDFSSFLFLETIIEDSPVESAQASGDIAFSLFDTTDIPDDILPDFLEDLLTNTNLIQEAPLAFFSLSGGLNTLGDGDSLIGEATPGAFTFTNLFDDRDFEGTEESVFAIVDGSFERFFASPTNLTLVATRSGQARVTAPEPSTGLALLLMLSLLSLLTKGGVKSLTSRPSTLVKIAKPNV